MGKSLINESVTNRRSDGCVMGEALAQKSKSLPSSQRRKRMVMDMFRSRNSVANEQRS